MRHDDVDELVGGEHERHVADLVLDDRVGIIDVDTDRADRQDVVRGEAQDQRLELIGARALVVPHGAVDRLRCGDDTHPRRPKRVHAHPPGRRTASA